MSAVQLDYMQRRLRALEARCRPVGTHFVFQTRPGKDGRQASDNSRGYVLVKLSIPECRPQSIVLARAVFICTTGDLSLLPGRGKSNLHVSHLCHVRNCINIEHLNLEEDFINQGRRLCNDMHRCGGRHGGEPGCIFD